MPITVLGGTKVADTTFSVANSCRFNDGDSPFHEKTPGSDGNRKIFSMSVWIKLGVLGTARNIMSAGSNSNNVAAIDLSTADRLGFWEYDGNTDYSLLTTRKLRDPSAWYHILCVLDTTQGTAANRAKIYINGVQETDLTTDTYPSEDYEGLVNTQIAHRVGKYGWNSANHFDGYMAEFVFIDGTAYGPTDFGEFDEDSPRIWKPKDVSGLTFGTNGFYLDFEASDNLGNDANGGTDLTESGLDASDQENDTPTNSFCVMNPNDNYYSVNTLSQGNCAVTCGSNQAMQTATIGVTSGKWYFEYIVNFDSSYSNTGITSKPASGTGVFVGHGDAVPSYGYKASDGDIVYNGSDVAYGSSFSSGAKVGCFIDLDNNKLYFAVNGTLQNSGTGHSITAATYFPALAQYDNTTTYTMNFGGCPAFAISSGNTDDNGYGNFEYSPNITGDGSAKSFYAICTKNLAEFG